MQVKEIFGLMVRLMGLFFVAYGVYALVDMFVPVCFLIYFSLAGDNTEPRWYVNYMQWSGRGVLFILAGWSIIRSSDRIVRWTSPRTVNTQLCAQCGYDMRATPGRCPECGTAVGTT